jgi:hypothetical protein
MNTFQSNTNTTRPMSLWLFVRVRHIVALVGREANYLFRRQAS